MFFFSLSIQLKLEAIDGPRHLARLSWAEAHNTFFSTISIQLKLEAIHRLSPIPLHPIPLIPPLPLHSPVLNGTERYSTVFNLHSTLPHQLQIPRLRLRAIAFIDDVEVSTYRQLVADGVDALLTDPFEDIFIVVITISFVYENTRPVEDLNVVVRELRNTVDHEVVILAVTVR